MHQIWQDKRKKITKDVERNIDKSTGIFYAFIVQVLFDCTCCFTILPTYISQMCTSPKNFEPLSSVTGRWRKRFSTMVTSASIAESDMATQVGSAVMTFATEVADAGNCLATTRRVISVSVMIPARLPLAFTIKAASPLLLARVCETKSTLSEVPIRIGFFGRSFETGLSSFFREIFADLTDALR